MASVVTWRLKEQQCCRDQSSGELFFVLLISPIFLKWRRNVKANCILFSLRPPPLEALDKPCKLLQKDSRPLEYRI